MLSQYAGHERSAESIEAAFEKILMASFINRKRTKINLKSRLKKQVEESPSWVKKLFACVEAPPTIIVLNRLFLFAFMAVWSVMNSAESGPAFQVCSTSFCFDCGLAFYLDKLRGHQVLIWGIQAGVKKSDVLPP